MTGGIDQRHARAAAKLLAERRTRDEVFGPDCDGFGEPGWEMLLALFVGEANGRRFSWTDVTAAASVSIPRAADRYLEWLISRRLARAEGNLVAISDHGRALIAMFLDHRERA